jgi:GT2 family glycosyltransferase
METTLNTNCKKITALIPTFHRPLGLARTLQSLRDTSDIKIVVALELDDVDGYKVAMNYGAVITFCIPPRAGCANAWNTALAASPNDDLYIIGADDAVFVEGWLGEALKGLDELGGSGLVGFESGHRKDYSDHYMMTRDFMIEHLGGVAAVPHYTSWCVDDEAILRARKVGKFYRSRTAVVRHDKGAENDAGYKMGQECRKENKELFYKRQDAGFPDDFERII